ncbi:transporter substrate-binding domain-containing protein [Pusillimonas sp. TS35]|uniref:ABC transporter substrate-binding protein n=1 Tax=Paracandidimonas lactea TaxID=2895524 RepID=UPI00136BD65A|nr:ABC transporter substrate-binding protein [Paracandidimonas lactea]MYN14267.1 transporter substrate-binding domain-containing protein [Pusillimonas sp. TS35]
MKLKTVIAGFAASLILAANVHAASEPVIKVGSTPTGVPFTFLDTKTNTIEGIMVDLVKAVGKEVGFSVQIEPMQFSALIGSLNSKRIDIIAAAMLTTPERQKVVSFTNPVMAYGEALLVPKTDGKSYHSFADMKGMNIGIQVGTSYIAPAEKSGAFSEIKLYETSTDLMRDVNNKRIQAGLMDYPIAVAAINDGRAPEMRIVKSYKSVIVRDLGLITRHENTELLEKMNKAIDKLKADGTVDKILVKWGLDPQQRK